MNGRRVETVEAVIGGAPGDYCPVFNDAGEVDHLWALLPSGSPARLPAEASDANVKWAITVEDDGSVTVAPSIQQLEIPNHAPAWHGFLEHGIWREA